MNANKLVRKYTSLSTIYTENSNYSYERPTNNSMRSRTDYEYNGNYDVMDDPADWNRPVKGVRIA